MNVGGDDAAVVAGGISFVKSIGIITLVDAVRNSASSSTTHCFAESCRRCDIRVVKRSANSSCCEGVFGIPEASIVLISLSIVVSMSACSV